MAGKNRIDRILNGRKNLDFPNMPAQMVAEMVYRNGKTNCHPIIRGDTVIYIWYKMPVPDDFIPFDN